MEKTTLFIALGLAAFSQYAQNTQAQTADFRPSHASMYLQPNVGSTTVPFDWNDVGREFVVRWGMDTAWDDEGNVRRGTNHIGKNLISTGRISFQPSDLVGRMASFLLPRKLPSIPASPISSFREPLRWKSTATTRRSMQPTTRASLSSGSALSRPP